MFLLRTCISVWDLWWIKWHWHRFFPPVLQFPPVYRTTNAPCSFTDLITDALRLYWLAASLHTTVTVLLYLFHFPLIRCNHPAGYCGGSGLYFYSVDIWFVSREALLTVVAEVFRDFLSSSHADALYYLCEVTTVSFQFFPSSSLVLSLCAPQTVSRNELPLWRMIDPL
jgi:hypothetical protein